MSQSKRVGERVTDRIVSINRHKMGKFAERLDTSELIFVAHVNELYRIQGTRDGWCVNYAVILAARERGIEHFYLIDKAGGMVYRATTTELLAHGTAGHADTWGQNVELKDDFWQKRPAREAPKTDFIEDVAGNHLRLERRFCPSTMRKGESR